MCGEIVSGIFFYQINPGRNVNGVTLTGHDCGRRGIFFGGGGGGRGGGVLVGGDRWNGVILSRNRVSEFPPGVV